MPRLHFTLSLVFLLCFAFLWPGCDVADSGTNEVTLSGRVLNAATQNPVAEAVVTITYQEDDEEQEELSAVTDTDGNFSTSIEIAEPVEVTFSASKSGITDQTSERVSPDFNEVDDITLELNLGEGEETEPGRPTNITLSEQSRDAIRVKESGGEEVARLTFQVVDSTGIPISLDQAVEVSFRFGKQPGDATLTPETVMTDGEGSATVNVNSGQKAGVVQVIAETEKADGTPIRSKPAALSIHGGLPNKCHFTVAPNQFNFPGLVDFNFTNSIIAIVGDKYGNPVVPGTAVYFSSNAGVIEGSTQTDDKGKGSVTLTSAQPLPDGGMSTVRAETIGTDDVNDLVDPNNCANPVDTGNEIRIYDTLPVLYSGRPEVRPDPTWAQLDTTYQLTVWDAENNNPLAPGTTINVVAEGTKVKAIGNTEVNLDDTVIRDTNNDGFGEEDIQNGDELTQFTFRTVEDLERDEGGDPKLEAVTISIGGPNGSVEIVLTPPTGGTTNTKMPQQNVTASEGASIHTTSTGETVIRAPKDE